MNGAGKTTVTAALLRIPDAALLSNDRLISYQRDHVVAVPLPVPTARGTIQAFPELECLVRHQNIGGSDLTRMPACFGSVVKQAFTARQFAEAFGARLIGESELRLIVVPRLTDTDDPVSVRPLSIAAACRVVGTNCFTPCDEFWVRPWLVPRHSSEEELDNQARSAVEYLAATVPCIMLSFGVHNPVSDLVRALKDAAGGVL